MNIFAKAQDVLTEKSKDRLVSVHRWNSHRSGNLIADQFGREELVRKGQEEFLLMDRVDRHDALNNDFSNHSSQQEQLKAMRRDGL